MYLFTVHLELLNENGMHCSICGCKMLIVCWWYMCVWFQNCSLKHLSEYFLSL